MLFAAADTRGYSACLTSVAGLSGRTWSYSSHQVSSDSLNADLEDHQLHRARVHCSFHPGCGTRVDSDGDVPRFVLFAVVGVRNLSDVSFGMRPTRHRSAIPCAIHRACI